MSNIKLITAADDRHGRKGGQYAQTQERIQDLLTGWIDQRHYKLHDFIDCDPLMVNIDAAKNGRVYKPWVIQHALSQMADGDYLIYNDCSPEMWPEDIDLSQYDIRTITLLCDFSNGLLVGFVKWSDEWLGANELGQHTHDNFTLDSCIEIMGGEAYRHSYLCASGMIVIRKDATTVRLVDDWLHYNRIKECACMNVSEHERSYNDPTPTNLGNRHDQSVLSLLLNRLDWKYCDIAYNDLSPYNFLNFCLPNHEYKFINSNP
ncbi:MAG: hypothetical protein V4560_14715 [Bacteroidota bacterium]